MFTLSLRLPVTSLLIGLFVCFPSVAEVAASSPHAGKKIFYLNSYHQGYGWSDGIQRAVVENLNGTGVELKIHWMNSKLHQEPEFIARAAREAHAAIEAFKPDVLIASDDNASRHVVMPYYRDTALPVVFCGVNWDAGVYGYPYSNATGMVEVTLVDKVVAHLETYARGKRLGYLAGNRVTARKQGDYYQRRFNLHLDKVYYVDNFAQWRDAFLRLQQEVDMLIIGIHDGIPDWDMEWAVRLAREHSRIPTGATYEWLMPLTLLGLTIIPEEQGEWAAQTALRILDGTPPSEIPPVYNQRGKLFLNLVLGNRLGIVFDKDLLKIAEIIKD